MYLVGGREWCEDYLRSCDVLVSELSLVLAGFPFLSSRQVSAQAWATEASNGLAP